MQADVEFDVDAHPRAQFLRQCEVLPQTFGAIDSTSTYQP